MLKVRILRNFAVLLATVSLLIPQQLLHAAQPVNSPVKDVVLSSGSLHGRVVNGQGQPLDGAAVVIQQANAEIARTISDDVGEFNLKLNRAGVYQLTAGGTTVAYRVWTEDAAPPAALEQAIVVVQEGTSSMRGAIGGPGINPFNIIVITAVVAGGIIGGIAISDNNNSTTSLPPSSP